nr:MAG TPA: Prohead core protein protease [Caudoviricetes sp.]
MSSVNLIEAEGEPTGSLVAVTIITPGKGSSGEYPPETIKKLAESPIWDSPVHMYMNHATGSERASRPEGDIRELAGVIDGRPVIDDSGALVGRAKIFPEYRDFIRERAPYIGVSINASGIMAPGKDRVVKEITQVDSVDFVTKPGRGGKITAVLESSREVDGMANNIVEADGVPVTKQTAAPAPVQDAPKAESPEVTELKKQIEDLKAERDELKAKVEELQAESAKKDAEAVVAEAFRNVDAPMTRKMLVESATGLTHEEFETRVQESLKEVLAAKSATSPVYGMGAPVQESQSATVDDILSIMKGL